MRPPDPSPERRTDGTVDIADHDPGWAEAFRTEQERLEDALPMALSVEHIGSTAVPGLAAKPTIDILVVVVRIEDVVPSRVAALDGLGYDYRGPFAGEEDTHAFFRKVRDGKRTHHLHVVSADSPEPARYRTFRDYLIASPEAAARYDAGKRDLIALHGTDRAAYIEGKTPVVEQLMDEALAWSAGHG